MVAVIKSRQINSLMGQLNCPDKPPDDGGGVVASIGRGDTQSVSEKLADCQLG
jgi:hypothetical protein